MAIVVEACHLPTPARYVPLVGDRYVRSRNPNGGDEMRCMIIGLSSAGGIFASVRFYDEERGVPAGEPVIVSVSTIEPILYPESGFRFDEGYPLPKSVLMCTNPEAGLSSIEAARRTRMLGPNALDEPERQRLVELLKCFSGPMPVMIWLAICVELLLQTWADFAVLLILQLINGFTCWQEEMSAGGAVAALKASLQPEATCKRNGSWSNFSASGLVPGDIVLLGAGSAVPADCELLGGPLTVDQAALTGGEFYT